MSVTKSCVLTVVLLRITAAYALAEPPANTLTPQEVDEGWVLLFDGETTFGWQALGKAEFEAKNGTLLARPGKDGCVCTTTQFPSFVMRSQIRADAKHPVALACCILPDKEARSRKLQPVGNGFTGLVVPLAGFGKGSANATGWHDIELRAEGKRVVLRQGGKVVAERDVSFPIRGHVGFVCANADATIAARGVTLKPLGLKAIFNGKDLTGWTPYPGRAGKYTVEPGGILHAVGGLGSITAPGQYKDFVLQLDGKTAAKGFQNSGIFFRSIPGEFIQGYEIQIFDEWHGNDRTRPKDWGTGAVYRRQAARKVYSTKGEWFTMTIIAHGKHVATWVNGHQAADWIDTRPRHENPRRGCRTDAGEIIIQAHDKNSRLWFRDIRIDEYPAVGEE